MTRKARTRANGEGTIIYRAKENRYEARFYITLPDGSRVRRSVYATKKKIAGDRMRAALEEAEKGRFPLDNKDTLQAFHDYWLSEIAPKTLQRNTIFLYETQFRRHILPKLGKRKITSIQPVDVQNLLSQVEAKTGSVKVAADTKTALSSMFKKALNLGKVSINPVRGTETSLYKPKEKVLWNEQELCIFLNYTKEKDRFYPAYMLLSRCGLRIGELLGLKARDIELFDTPNKNGEWGEIHINQQIRMVDYRLEEAPLKTKSSKRTLPITEEMHSVLKEYITKSCDSDKDKLLFHTKSDTPLQASYLRRCFKDSINRAGLKQVTIHSLRHSFCTTLNNLGIDVRTNSEMMGHSDPSVTMKVYQHSNINNKINAMSRLSDYYAAISREM